MATTSGTIGVGSNSINRDFQDRNPGTLGARLDNSMTQSAFSILETSIPEYARQLPTWPNCYWDFTVSDAWHLQAGGWAEDAWDKGGVYYAPFVNVEMKTLNQILTESNKFQYIGMRRTDNVLNINKKVTIGNKEFWTPIGALTQQAIESVLKQMGNNAWYTQSAGMHTPSFIEALQILCEAVLNEGKSRKEILVTYIDLQGWIFSVSDKITDNGVTAWYTRPDDQLNWLQYVKIYYVQNVTEISGTEIRFRTKELGMPFIQIDLDEHAMGFRYPKQARPEGTVGISFLESHDWIIHDWLVYWKSLLFESGSRTFGNVMTAGMYGLLRIYIPYWNKDAVNKDDTKGATEYYIKRIKYWNLMCVDISEMKLEYEDGGEHMVEAEFSVEWITSSNTRQDMIADKIPDKSVKQDAKRLTDLDTITQAIQAAKDIYYSELESNKDSVWAQTGQAFKSLQVEDPNSSNTLGQDVTTPDTEVSTGLLG